MVSAMRSLVLIAASFAAASATASKVLLYTSPVRRVVTMLQKMQKQSEKEGKIDQQLFDKVMCACKTDVPKLGKSIEDASAKVEQLTNDIEETSASAKQTKADIVKAKKDRKEAEGALASAASLRKNQMQAYDKVFADANTNIASMKKAVVALKKGTSSAFLQSRAGGNLRRLSISMDLTTSDRDVLTTFLSDGKSSDLSFSPSSGEIVGILTQMVETMQEDLAKSVAEEKKAVSDYESLVAAKEKQVDSLTREVETKVARAGEADVSLVNFKEDLDDNQKSLKENSALLVDMKKDCKVKLAEKDITDKNRNDELVALADTIKILNDNDAAGMFKSMLQEAPSLLQVQVTDKSLKRQALQVLDEAKRHNNDFRLNLISLTLRGKKVSMDKVIKMIDDMTKLLKAEQVADDKKVDYCEKEIAKTKDILQGLKLKIGDYSKAIDNHKEKISAINEDIAKATKSIQDTDKQVKAADDQRKQENAIFQKTRQGNSAAVELLEMAKNRLAKFYNKASLAQVAQVDQHPAPLAPTPASGGDDATAAFDQYEAEAKEDSDLETKAETKAEAEVGAEAKAEAEAPAEAPAEAEAPAAEEQNDSSFLQVHASKKAESKNPFRMTAPETTSSEVASSYIQDQAAKPQQSAGVMVLLDMIIGDKKTEMKVNGANEKKSQADYEDLLAKAKLKRNQDSKTLENKAGMKVEQETRKLKKEQGRTKSVNEVAAAKKTMDNLAEECTWLTTNFEARKTARRQELGNLDNAKAVLGGANYDGF